MTASHLETGLLGESLAATHLVGEGFAILDRRLRVAGIEVDIVAQRGDVIHFVEVKCRTAHGPDPLPADYGPEVAVDTAKIERLECAAEAYVTSRGLMCELSVDLVSVVVNPRGELLALRVYHQIGRMF